eukprot:COSAG01_NODE_6298_length_3748_cov_8.162510_3_plen_43_part_00
MPRKKSSDGGLRMISGREMLTDVGVLDAMRCSLRLFAMSEML